MHDIMLIYRAGISAPFYAMAETLVQTIPYFKGETNHRPNYTTGFSGTEDDEAYGGAKGRESQTV